METFCRNMDHQYPARRPVYSCFLRFQVAWVEIPSMGRIDYLGNFALLWNCAHFYLAAERRCGKRKELCRDDAPGRFQPVCHCTPPAVHGWNLVQPGADAACATLAGNYIGTSIYCTDLLGNLCS